MTNKLSKHTLFEGEMCFKYFNDIGSSPTNMGLMLDKYPSNHDMCSIAATGFYLSAMVAGVEMGWIDLVAAQHNALQCLNTVLHLPKEHGFFYHFYSVSRRDRYNNCEVSNIDTALLVAGALSAGQYFGGEVKQLADTIYADVDWSYFADSSRRMFFMSQHNGIFHGQWDVYAEQLLLYVLSVNCPNEQYRVPAEYYYTFDRTVGTYGQYSYMNSWFGSLFTHQFSHAFVDFSCLVDKLGANWHDNSVMATLANRQFCMDNSNKYPSYGENSWGLTACMIEGGYEGRIGCSPSGNDNIEHLSEGTVPPCGAIGSIIFTPELSMQAIEHYYTIDGLCGEYGLLDSFNGSWVSSDYISIDKGISLAMIANYYNGSVQRSFMSHPSITSALIQLGLNSK